MKKMVEFDTFRDFIVSIIILGKHSNRYNAWKKKMTDSIKTPTNTTTISLAHFFAFLLSPRITLVEGCKALDSNVAFKFALEFIPDVKLWFNRRVKGFRYGEAVKYCRCFHFLGDFGYKVSHFFATLLGNFWFLLKSTHFSTQIPAMFKCCYWVSVYSSLNGRHGM